MDFGPIVATLHAASLSETLEFYTSALGFDVKWSYGEDGFDSDAPTFACVENGAAVLFFGAKGGTERAVLFVELHHVEDVHELAASLAEDGIRLTEPTDEPWGSREFWVRDPNGHELRFSCPTDRVRPRE